MLLLLRAFDVDLSRENGGERGGGDGEVYTDVVRIHVIIGADLLTKNSAGTKRPVIVVLT